MVDQHQTISYKARRLRFGIGATLLIPMTAVMLWLADSAFKRSAGQALLWSALVCLYVFLSYVVITKLVWPPEVEISVTGFRYTNRGLRIGGTYRWDELDGPIQIPGVYGVPLVQMIVKSSGRKLRFPPSHFDATYGEMAAVIDNARAGHLVNPEGWREEHPRNRLREWTVQWGLPIAGGIGLAWLLH